MSGIAQAFFCAGGSAGAVSFFTSTSTEAATITIPANAQAGDVGVLLQTAMSEASSISGGTPSGWTSAVNTAFSGAFIAQARCGFKVLTSGDPGATVTGMSSDLDFKVLLVFRPAFSFSTCTAGGAVGAVDPGDVLPSQVKSITGLSAPVIVIAHNAFAGATALTFSPAADDVLNIDSAVSAAYKIYDSTPTANLTVSSTSGESPNFLQSFYLTFA